MAISQNNTDLRGSCTLLGQLADLVNDLIGGGLQPCGRIARVGDRGRGDTLALAVKTAHLESWRCREGVCRGRKVVVVEVLNKSFFVRLWSLKVEVLIVWVT